MDVLFYYHNGRYIDIRPRNFHGYTVLWEGGVVGQKGELLKLEKRYRRGKTGKFDWCVRLCYNGKKRKWTLSRLIGSCFFGCIDGMEMNHKDRDPTNCHGTNLEISTRSENQIHWRDDDNIKRDLRKCASM